MRLPNPRVAWRRWRAWRHDILEHEGGKAVFLVAAIEAIPVMWALAAIIAFVQYVVRP